MLGEEDRILKEIERLKSEHTTISHELDSGGIDDLLRQQRMKKRKLLLKDQISHMYGFLTPDGAA